MYPELAVIGFTNIDVNTTPSTKMILQGGAGYFAAIAASRIIPNVGLVARVGNDFDPTFLLSRVTSDGVHIDQKEQSGRSYQIYSSDFDKSKRTITIELGANKNLSPSDIPAGWLPNLKIVHIATMPPDQQSEFIHYLRKRAGRVFLSFDTDIFLLNDQHTKRAVEDSLQNIDLAFVNRAEYAALKPVIDQRDHTVVKLDKDGAMYLTKGKIEKVAHGTPVVAVDATGAGDIFAGTFLACRLIGHTLTQSLKKAVEVATLSVTRVGVDHLFS